MTNEIRHTWQFDQSPEEVWEYLTQPDLLELWLMKTDFQPIVGHQFTFDCGVTTYCEVLEVKPYTRLVYTWGSPDAKDKKPYTSKVTWTLAKKGGGTELVLVHNGFTVLEEVLGHNLGWTKTGTKLAETLNAIQYDPATA